MEQRLSDIGMVCLGGSVSPHDYFTENEPSEKDLFGIYQRMEDVLDLVIENYFK